MAVAEKNKQNQYFEYADQHLVPARNSFVVENHRPTPFMDAYHHHASLEMNFLIGCDMEYSFSGRKFMLDQTRMSVFWGAAPHCVTNVYGEGEIVNIYISLARLLRLGLPDHMIEAIIGGTVIASEAGDERDVAQFRQWAQDYKRSDPAWHRLIVGEVEMRLRRLALEGYETLLAGTTAANVEVKGGETMRYIDKMLRFIADNFGSAISISDVADHVDLSPSYAMSIFRRTVGVPIKEHITRIRLSHAQMLLVNSDLKIIAVAMDSGFGSLSSFYEAFQMHMAKTPAAFRKEARQ